MIHRHVARMCGLGVVLATIPLSAAAVSDADINELREQLKALKQTYEQRIEALEKRLAAAESQAVAPENRSSQPAPAEITGTTAAASAFNPAVSLILSGIYTNLSRDPANYAITGFPVPADAEIGPGKRGLRLAETELGVYANIDPYFYGGLNFSIHPDDTVSTEEAFIQTLGLTHGLTVKAGRFYSGIGYLNEQHAHTWDFVDNPLVYQAMLGTQFNQDGVQLRWLAPTETFLELGAEVGRGRSFPGSDRDKNGIGAGAVLAHVGGDVGVGSSWRAGLSLLQTGPRQRQLEMTDVSGNAVTNAFSGDSHLWIADFVWKYAPNGNATRTNFKLQGEYLRRHERGDLTYDVANIASSAPYDAVGSGWYVQGVYQFMPYWRVGLRTERLSLDHVDYGANGVYLAAPNYAPSKNSLMLDYSPSEFSRIRLQLAADKSRHDRTDNQLFLQYQMSLGAHGAHIF